MDHLSKSVADYKDKHAIYANFAKRIEALLQDLLNAKTIKFQLIESRAKSIESFSEKLSRPGKSYKNPLVEFADLVGVRIIVYYNDDLQTVSQVIKEEFEIIEQETSHQLEKFDVDRFGYLSLHFVVKLGDARHKLSEWKPYNNLHAEIQVRTVLQHSWAAVSHALQYKRETDVPPQLKRRLFRMAGLFELADEELRAIRDEHRIISLNTKDAIAQGNTSVPVNAVSLKAFVQTWPPFSAIRELAEKNGFSLESSFEDDYSMFSAVAAQATRIGIHSISELEQVLDVNPQTYFRKLIAASEADDSTEWKVDDDFLLYLLLIKARPREFKPSDLVKTGGWDSDVAKRVISIAKSKTRS